MRELIRHAFINPIPTALTVKTPIEATPIEIFSRESIPVEINYEILSKVYCFVWIWLFAIYLDKAIDYSLSTVDCTWHPFVSHLMNA